MPQPNRHRLDLTPGRLQLAVLAVGLLAGGLWAAVTLAGPGRVWNPQGLGVDWPRVGRATERIDPNTASVGSLRRLPNIGPLRAQKIVEYRQDHPPRPFRTAGDLMKVPGIGLGTARRAAPHLALPDDLP